MTAPLPRVGLFRVDPNYAADVLIGRPVRAQTHDTLARLVQWVRGRGRCLVPAFHPRFELVAPASSICRFWVAPSGPAIARVWLVDVRASTKTGAAQFQADGDLGRFVVRSVDGRSANARTAIVIDYDATQGTTAQEISLAIAALVGTIRVESISCYELPRAALDPTSGYDLGIDLDSFYPRRDVYESDTGGLHEMAVAIDGTDTRRCGHAYFWHETGIVTTSGAYVDVFLKPIPLIASKDRIANTTRTIEFNAYGYASNGTTTGDIRMKDTAGNFSTPISIPLLGTTGAWRGVQSMAFLCEDPSTSNGVRAGNETIQFQVRRTAGAGNVIWQGFGAYEKVV